jgi:hypothetical protein
MMCEKLNAVSVVRIALNNDRKGRGQTIVIQVLSKHLLVSMASSCNVEITLHLVHLQATKNPTAVPTRLPPLQLRCLCKFGFSTSSMRNDIMYMLLSKTFLMIMESLSSNNPPLCIFPQPMHTPSVYPLSPIRWILLQHFSSKNPIPSSILNIDVNIGTLHRNHNVQVDLEIMAYALFYREGVSFVAAPPACELGEYEEERDAEHCDSPFPAARCLRYILGLCLGCEWVSSYSSIQLYFL